MQSKYLVILGVVALLCVLIYAYGRSRYDAGYADAFAKIQKSGSIAQTTVLVAPKASRNDKEFIDAVRKGEW